jgi:hypothetical protein
MREVFAVTSGSYSDYHIVAMFSTKELAEEFIRLIPDEEYNGIEEYELNPPVSDLIKRGYSIWCILMLRNGDTELVERVEMCSWVVNDVDSRLWRRSASTAYNMKGKPDVLVSRVWAKTEKQAIKIVNEYRTQMIANGKWE